MAHTGYHSYHRVEELCVAGRWASQHGWEFLHPSELCVPQEGPVCTTSHGHDGWQALVSVLLIKQSKEDSSRELLVDGSRYATSKVRSHLSKLYLMRSSGQSLLTNGTEQSLV